MDKLNAEITVTQPLNATIDVPQEYVPLYSADGERLCDVNGVELYANIKGKKLKITVKTELP